MWETIDYILQKNSEFKTKQLKLNKMKFTWIWGKHQTTWFRNDSSPIGETLDQVKGGTEKKLFMVKSFYKCSVFFNVWKLKMDLKVSMSHTDTHICSTHANTHTQRRRQTRTNPSANTEIRVKKKKLEKLAKEVKVIQTPTIESYQIFCQKWEDSRKTVLKY